MPGKMLKPPRAGLSCSVERPALGKQSLQPNEPVSARDLQLCLFRRCPTRSGQFHPLFAATRSSEPELEERPGTQ